MDVPVVENTRSDGISGVDLKIMNEYDVLVAHRWRVSTDRVERNIERVSITSIHNGPRALPGRSTPVSRELQHGTSPWPVVRGALGSRFGPETERRGINIERKHGWHRDK